MKSGTYSFSEEGKRKNAGIREFLREEERMLKYI